MKTTRDDILLTALRLFAKDGYEAVSVSQIAGELDITKGALYRHFKNKRDIFDSLINRMFELDASSADESGVPEKTYIDSPDSYTKTEFYNLSQFIKQQFIFWTEDEFGSNFRKLLTLEQYRNEEMNKLYQDMITTGPVKYTEDLLSEMIKSGKLNQAANEMGPKNMAILLFAPLHLLIQMADGGLDKEILCTQLEAVTSDFKKRFIN